MNKAKGFTLIEIMGVIIIIGLLGLLAFPPIINQIKNSKSELSKVTLELIYAANSLYIDQNIYNYPKYEGNVYCISLQTLVDDGKLQEPIIDSVTGETVDLNKVVRTFFETDSKYINEIVNNGDCMPTDVRPIYSDKSGASAPELVIGMIPVVWNGIDWVKADAHNQWYDYDKQEWANAVTVISSKRSSYMSAVTGTVIPISDINTMWVWIPRYKYAIPTGSGAREINIVFESKTTNKSTGNAIDTNYRTHPAFTFGTTEVSGIWVGKFETTGKLSKPTILPNVTSLRSETVKSFYDSARSINNNSDYGFGSDSDAHMMKNDEWGAVAYLSHSKYGKYGNKMYDKINKEIYQNKSNTYMTGSSNGTPSQSATNSQCRYDDITDRGNGTGACGAGASTTGNIYGIYDMSGGAYEYVMGMLRPNDSSSVTDISGFGASTSKGTLPESKYWNQYLTANNTNACSGGICYGHALSETSGWYGDNTSFVFDINPWSLRGGFYSMNTNAGIFGSSISEGSSYSNYSFRITLVNI